MATGQQRQAHSSPQVDDEARGFRDFREAIQKHEQHADAGRPDDREMSPDNTSAHDYTKDLFDVKHEICLLEQVKDIQDELHIMGLIFQDQGAVVEQFRVLVTNEPGAKIQHAVLKCQNDIRKLEHQAKQAYGQVRRSPATFSINFSLTFTACWALRSEVQIRKSSGSALRA